MVNNSIDRLLTELEASEIIGFSKNTLRAWRVSGRTNKMTPPSFIKCGRAVRYRLSDLQAWMEGQITLRTTSDPGAEA
ncbi:MAG: helix-turn-helix domain-containing protein [Sedimenticola sp.]